jgi:ADP-ribose pyrophosphatase
MPDDDQVRRYRALRTLHPELFAAPPGATVRILHELVDHTRAAGPDPAVGVLLDDPHLVVVREPVELTGGRRRTFVRSLAPHNTAGVVILARIGFDIALVRHFRHASRRWHLELPRGFGTTHMSPADDARRELREELGAEVTDLRHLGVVYADAGMHATATHLFYADAVRRHEPDGDEGISDILLLAPAELAGLVADGAVDDSFTLAACARAAAQGLIRLG